MRARSSSRCSATSAPSSPSRLACGTPRALAEIAPDVVIADMILRKSSGFTLIREARERGSRVPFIAVSGQDYDPSELKRAGFAAYLRKPLDHTKLVDTILAVGPRR